MRRSISPSSSQGPVVTLPWGGRLRGGVQDPPNNVSPYEAFVGVPYAEPPTGELRFVPPKPAKKWTGVRDAVEEGQPCPQIDFYTRKVTGSEDCLWLNVYRPVGVRSGDKKPVLVYIHYGMWSLNNCNQNEIGPEFLVEKDIVVAVVNYRVLSFGFASLNSPVCAGNVGIRDCILALHWINENIGAFGGDPKRVTLFGYCVGGYIANMLQFQESCKGLFHQCIALSGTYGNTWYGSEPADMGRARTLKMAALLGCKLEKDEDILKYLQNTPVPDLFGATWQCALNPSPCDRSNPPFKPVIDGQSGLRKEDVLIPENPTTLVRKHKQVCPVPTIFGVCESDGHFTRPDIKFWSGCRADPHNLIDRYEMLERMLPWDLDLGHLGSPTRQQLVAEIKKLYFKNTTTPTLDEFYDFQGDVGMFRATVESARHHPLHPDKPPAWLLCFSLDGKINRSSRRFDFPAGMVTHCDDLGYYFGCRNEAPGPEPPLASDSAEAVARRRMVGLMANFVKYGHPTPEFEPEPDLGHIRAPQLPADLSTPYPYLDINKNLSIKHELCGARVRFWEDVYDRLYTNGDTEQARNAPFFEETTEEEMLASLRDGKDRAT